MSSRRVSFLLVPLLLATSPAAAQLSRSDAHKFLDAIKNELTASSGQLTASQTRLDNEKKSIADDKDKLAARDTAYRAQLTAQYTRMQGALSAFSSTQSYLSQQIKLWTNDSSS